MKKQVLTVLSIGFLVSPFAVAGDVGWKPTAAARAAEAMEHAEEARKDAQREIRMAPYRHAKSNLSRLRHQVLSRNSAIQATWDGNLREDILEGEVVLVNPSPYTDTEVYYPALLQYNRAAVAAEQREYDQYYQRALADHNRRAGWDPVKRWGCRPSRERVPRTCGFEVNFLHPVTTKDSTASALRLYYQTGNDHGDSWETNYAFHSIYELLDRTRDYRVVLLDRTLPDGKNPRGVAIEVNIKWTGVNTMKADLNQSFLKIKLEDGRIIPVGLATAVFKVVELTRPW